MAVSLSTLRDRVRVRLRDTDGRKPTYDPLEYDQAIAHAYITLEARLPGIVVYTASSFTIAAGGDTFSLPTTVTQWTGNSALAEYLDGLHIELRSNNKFLIPVKRTDLDRMRGDTSTLTLGTPAYAAVWEEKDQEIQGRCYPGARSAETCNLFAKMAAEDLRDFVGAGGSDNMDDVTVRITRSAANALELFTAADLLERMGPKALSERDIDKAVAPSWKRDAEILLYREAARRHGVTGGDPTSELGYGDDYGGDWGHG